MKCELYNETKGILNNAIILSNYKDKAVLYDYLELIYKRFGDINEINNTLNYCLKLLNHEYYDNLKYGIYYMVLKNYKKSQIMFERSIQLENTNFDTYFYFAEMLLQSSQFDKLNNIIQIIDNFDLEPTYGAEFDY